MNPSNSFRCSAERTLIIGVALFALGWVEKALAQETSIDPIFQTGYKYVFEQSREQDMTTKMKMAGISERSKDSSNLVATLAMDVASDGDKRRTVSASIARIRGESPSPLSGDQVKFDTAEVKDEVDFQELAKMGDQKKASSLMLSSMMKNLMGQKVEMVIENNELVKADAGTDGEKLLFGPSLCDEAWIRLTVDFMCSGFPSVPVKQGRRWSRKVVYPTTSSAENAGTPLEFNFTLDEIRPQGNGKGMLAKISYQAKLDSPITSKSEELGQKRISNTKELTITGTMSYDAEKRMFTQHDQTISTAADVDMPDMGAKSSITTKTTLGVKLLSFEPSAGASDAPAGEEQTDMIAERVWTDLKGRELTATLISLESGVGKFRRDSGVLFDYPVKKLSKADRELIEETNREAAAKAESATEGSN